jgi:hypothetical protein
MYLHNSSAKQKKQLHLATFNLGYNVQADRIAGTEAQQVQLCQKRYLPGSTTETGLSKCTENASDFLARYDLFGLQEVNRYTQHLLENAIRRWKKRMKFHSTYYFDQSWGVVVGFDETVTGPGHVIYAGHIPQNIYSPDRRGIIAVYFPKLFLVFINLHAPHNLNLEKEVQRILDEIEKFAPSNLAVYHAIMVGDFNDDSGRLINQKFSVFGQTLSLPHKEWVRSCCRDSQYKYPGDYIFTSNNDWKHYGFPEDYDRDRELMSDHDPVILK